jgi:hypothetical protein
MKVLLSTGIKICLGLIPFGSFLACQWFSTTYFAFPVALWVVIMVILLIICLGNIWLRMNVNVTRNLIKFSARVQAKYSWAKKYSGVLNEITQVGLDQYGSSQFRYFHPTNTNIFAPTYRPLIPIPILSYWPIFSLYLVFWPIYAYISALATWRIWLSVADFNSL